MYPLNNIKDKKATLSRPSWKFSKFGKIISVYTWLYCDPRKILNSMYLRRCKLPSRSEPLGSGVHSITWWILSMLNYRPPANPSKRMDKDHYLYIHRRIFYINIISYTIYMHLACKCFNCRKKNWEIFRSRLHYYVYT